MGRDEELQKLHQLLQENNQVAIAAIAGMGGLGKTELALRYAMTQHETYKGGICWLQPKIGDVRVQVVQFAKTHFDDLNPPEDCGLSAQVQYCWRSWREGDVLLVVDDVTDYQQIRPYLQGASSRFRVLMTTRQLLGASIKQLPLDVLQPDAALELLRSLLAETPERIERELDVANQLCEWLGYLPLGLELVGRYLARKPALSLSAMMQRLEKKRLEQPALVKPEADMTAQLGVQAAFELSWQELAEGDQQLGCLISLFAAAPIPWKLVEQCLPEEDEEDLEEIRDDKLLYLHLLQRKGEEIYQLHPLLREFFQSKLTGLEQVEEFKRSLCQVMVAVAKKISETPTIEEINAVSLAIPHLDEVANNLIQYVSDQDCILPFCGLARFYEGQGISDQAEPWYQQCLYFAQKYFGLEHPNVAISFNNLAFNYSNQGRYNEAELLYHQALETYQRLPGEEHHYNIAATLNNLALLYNDQDRYTDAEPLFVQALEMLQSLPGTEHYQALCLNNLALLYKYQERYKKAEPLYRQALEITQHLKGKEHSDVALCLNNLACLCDCQGRYIEAKHLHYQALVMRQRLQGEEHPDVADSLNNLGLHYYSQGRYKKAVPLFLQALEIRERRLGVSHDDTVDTRENLADCQQA